MASARFVIGAVASAVVHVGAFAGMQRAHAAVKPAAPAVVIEVDTTAPPPPPPAPPAPEKEKEAEPAAAPLHESVAKANSAPPPAAQAGKTLTANDDSNAVADFTMVQGSGTYVGGVTASNGTSKAPVNERGGGAAAAAKTGTGGSGEAATGTDKSSRAVQLGSDWACPFPSSAKRDLAFVTVVVRVKPDGRPESASVVADPGEGFGAAAQACAMRQRYQPAKGTSGEAIAGTTSPFRIRFTR